MKKLLFGMIAAVSLTAANAQILITQYYEGASNDKYVEIKNVGTTSIDFTTDIYYLGLWSNANRGGWLTDTAPTSFLTLNTGSLAAGGTVVYKNSGAANPAYAATAGVAANTFVNFNGDDSIAIWTGNATFDTDLLVDTFGVTANIAADTSFVRTGIGSVQTSGYSTVGGITGSGFWTQVSLATVASASSGTDNYLGFSSVTVPEPTSATMLLGGVGAMFWVIRRKRIFA